MSNLAKLRLEHAQLIETVGRLAELVAKPEPPDVSDLFKVRHELTSTLVGHLKAEDWVLYPRLLSSPDPQVAGMARAFSDGMGGLADAYRAHTEKWTALSITFDWSGYCDETNTIIQALSSRIHRENRELYPLLEAMEKAA
jgi:iron-sulfur cluster repair protein YtfE (RIC family)